MNPFKRPEDEDRKSFSKPIVSDQRPGAIDPRAQQVDTFPLDAFEFDDPKVSPTPRVMLKDPWTWEVQSEIDALDVEVVKLAVHLNLSTTTALRNRTNNVNPANLYLTALNADGTTYNGRFVIKLRYNGNNFITAYTSSSNESFKSYAIPAEVTHTVPPYYVEEIYAQLYAAGGTVELLDEGKCSLNLESGTSSVYWGSMTSAPIEDFINEDYYFDSRTSVLGGGILRYYDGSAWVEMLSTHPSYKDALWSSLADMGEWATLQGSPIAASTAIFNKLVTADAFIANLFSQSITVGTGGRIRYETGFGVQKRCVQLADEKIDWLDIPDTIPATPERLQARIGRLGVGPSILLDGEFVIPLLGNISTPVTISSPTGFHSYYGTRPNGNIFIGYLSTTNYIWERELSSGVWGSASNTGIYTTSNFLYGTMGNGELFLIYSTGSAILRRVWSGSAWGAPVTILTITNAVSLDWIERSNGEQRISFAIQNADLLIELIYNGSSWVRYDRGFAFNKSSYYEELGVLSIIYNLTGGLYERVFSNSTLSWGNAVNQNYSESVDAVEVFNVLSGIGMVYSRGANYIKFSKRVNGQWEEPVVLTPSAGRSRQYPSAIQSSNGRVRVSYLDYTATYYIEEIVVDFYARVGAGIISSDATTVTFGDGTVLNKSSVPTDHKSAATTYGVGDSSNYGHVKVDASPADGSNNAVASNGVFDALALKANLADADFALLKYKTIPISLTAPDGFQAVVGASPITITMSNADVCDLDGRYTMVAYGGYISTVEVAGMELYQYTPLSIGGASPVIARLNDRDVAVFTSVLQIYRMNDSTKNWATVGNSLATATIQNGSAAALSSTVVALVNGNTDNIVVYSFNGTSWSAIGTSFSLPASLAYTIRALNSTDVAIAYGNNYMGVYRWNGSTWSQVGSTYTVPFAFSNKIAMTVINSSLLALWGSNGEVAMFRWSGTAFSEFGNRYTLASVAYCAMAKLVCGMYLMANPSTDTVFLLEPSGGKIIGGHV